MVQYSVWCEVTLQYSVWCSIVQCEVAVSDVTHTDCFVRGALAVYDGLLVPALVACTTSPRRVTYPAPGPLYIRVTYTAPLPCGKVELSEKSRMYEVLTLN